MEWIWAFVVVLDVSKGWIYHIKYLAIIKLNCYFNHCFTVCFESYGSATDLSSCMARFVRNYTVSSWDMLGGFPLHHSVTHSWFSILLDHLHDTSRTFPLPVFLVVMDASNIYGCDYGLNTLRCKTTVKDIGLWYSISRHHGTK